ncbi:MAG TPA: hypothetical protein VN838_12140 [Bradyrhizobium sp.]|nr:hypothetical protein [Bradyrhizobium sp.]
MDVNSERRARDRDELDGGRAVPVPKPWGAHQFQPGDVVQVIESGEDLPWGGRYRVVAVGNWYSSAKWVQLENGRQYYATRFRLFERGDGWAPPHTEWQPGDVLRLVCRSSGQNAICTLLEPVRPNGIARVMLDDGKVRGFPHDQFEWMRRDDLAVQMAAAFRAAADRARQEERRSAASGSDDELDIAPSLSSADPSRHMDWQERKLAHLRDLRSQAEDHRHTIDRIVAELMAATGGVQVRVYDEDGKLVFCNREGK